MLLVRPSRGLRAVLQNAVDQGKLPAARASAMYVLARLHDTPKTTLKVRLGYVAIFLALRVFLRFDWPVLGMAEALTAAFYDDLRDDVGEADAEQCAEVCANVFHQAALERKVIGPEDFSSYGYRMVLHV